MPAGRVFHADGIKEEEMEVIKWCNVTQELVDKLQAEGCYLKHYKAGEEEFLYVIHPARIKGESAT